jgi:hypothetical protein
MENALNTIPITTGFQRANRQLVSMYRTAFRPNHSAFVRSMGHDFLMTNMVMKVHNYMEMGSLQDYLYSLHSDRKMEVK